MSYQHSLDLTFADLVSVLKRQQFSSHRWVSLFAGWHNGSSIITISAKVTGNECWYQHGFAKAIQRLEGLNGGKAGL